METKKIALIGGSAIVIAYLFWRRATAQLTVNEGDEIIPEIVPESGMNIPGYQGGDFISDIDVLVNPNLLAMLQYKMMPLFGFVGTTVIETPVYVPVPEKKKPKRTRFSSRMSPGGGGGGARYSGLRSA